MGSEIDLIFVNINFMVRQIFKLIFFIKFDMKFPKFDV